MKKEFIRVRSVKDITITATAIILGGILIAIPTGAGVNITGFFLIFAGIILALVMRTGYKDMETGEKYLKKELYFQQAMHAAVVSAVSSRPESVDLSQKDKGNSLRIDVYFSRHAGKGYVQVFEYVPYKYEPCSEIYEYDLKRVEKLIK